MSDGITDMLRMIDAQKKKRAAAKTKRWTDEDMKRAFRSGHMIGQSEAEKYAELSADAWMDTEVEVAASDGTFDELPHADAVEVEVRLDGQDPAGMSWYTFVSPANLEGRYLLIPLGEGE